MYNPWAWIIVDNVDYIDKKVTYHWNSNEKATYGRVCLADSNYMRPQVGNCLSSYNLCL